jgi:hypothetical protein
MNTPSITGGKTAKAYQAAQPIGKAWINKVQVKKGTNAGKELEVLNLTLDRGVVLNDINENCKISLWPNNKREGIKDADYRVSIQLPT